MGHPKCLPSQVSEKSYPTTTTLAKCQNWPCKPHFFACIYLKFFVFQLRCLCISFWICLSISWNLVICVILYAKICFPHRLSGHRNLPTASFLRLQFFRTPYFAILAFGHPILPPWLNRVHPYTETESLQYCLPAVWLQHPSNSLWISDVLEISIHYTRAMLQLQVAKNLQVAEDQDLL